MFSIGHKVPFQIHLQYLDVKNSVQKRTKRIRIPCRKLIKTLTYCTGEKKIKLKKAYKLDWNFVGNNHLCWNKSRIKDFGKIVTI